MLSRGYQQLKDHGGRRHRNYRTGVCKTFYFHIPYFDANTMVSPGRLLAYDATAFGTFGDGSRQLWVSWDSQDWNLGFSFCKFTPPVVANGKLYVPTYDARVDVYGLA